MERAGVSLKSKLFSTNPWSKEGCVRTGCFPCLPEGGDCRRDNLVYYMQCNSCLKQGEGEGGPKVQIYWGETSRTLFQRGKEHWAAYASKSEASVLHKHEHHQNVLAEWRMKVYNYHSKPL